MNFRKSVGLTISDICADCELETDSIEHKLLYCKTFDCELRNSFRNFIGNKDYRDVIFFIEHFTNITNNST